MNEVIYNRKAAIRNTIAYAVALVLAILAIGGSIAIRSIPGFIIGGVVGLWAI